MPTTASQWSGLGQHQHEPLGEGHPRRLARWGSDGEQRDATGHELRLRQRGSCRIAGGARAAQPEQQYGTGPAAQAQQRSHFFAVTRAVRLPRARGASIC
jgi:hypothetical protein